MNIRSILVSAVVFLGLAAAAPAQTVLAGWNTSALVGGNGVWGPATLAPTVADANVTIQGLTRGGGVLTPATSSAAARGWGGADWVSSTATAAIAAGDFVTFSLSAAAGYELSLSSISTFSYRRSGTGATTGLVQYSLDGTTFTDITTVSFSNSTSSGATLPAIDLSTITPLQSIAAGTVATFRIVNYGGTSSNGTWYIFDVANTTAPDFAVSGTITAAPIPEPSTYAAIFGALALAGVVVQRRRRALLVSA